MSRSARVAAASVTADKASAKLARVLSPEDRAKFDEVAKHYVKYAQRYLKGLRIGG